MHVMDPSGAKTIESLYREHYYHLFLYARSSFRDSSLAEDAIQETFRIACGKMDQLLSSPNPGGWLMSTLKYVIKNEERAQRKMQLILQNAKLSQRVSEEFPDDCGISESAQELLPTADLELLWCIIIEGYSYLEASERFGITLETCKKRVYRLKKTLRKKIEK